MAWGDLGSSSASSGASSLETAAVSSTTAPGGTKTTVVTYTSSGATTIPLIVGTSSVYGRWFLTHNSVDIDERWAAPSRTVRFDFGQGVYALANTDTLELKFQSVTTETKVADVNGTIYKAV